MFWLRWQRRRQVRKSRHPLLREFLSYPLPSRRTPVQAVSFLSVDLETTSLDPGEGEIASIGWVAIEQGLVQLCSAEHHLVAVANGVGQSAIYHQISDQELATADEAGTVADRFMTAATGKVMVFHNAGLDLAYLTQTARQRYGANLVAPIVDTMRLEKRKLDRRHVAIKPGDLRLFACRQRYGLPDYDAHNALTDAVATAELLLAQMAYLGPDAVLRDLL